MKKTILIFFILLQLDLLSNNILLKEPLNNSYYDIDEVNVINFDWENTSNNYQLEISTDSTFGAPLTYQTNLSNINIDLSTFALTRHYWRVTSPSDTSMTRRFNIINLNQIGNIAYRLDPNKEVVANNSNGVSFWGNLADSTYDLSQNISNRMPELIDQGVNNNNVVFFGGNVGTSRHSLSQSTFEITDTNFTIVMAYKQESLNAPLSYILGASNPSSGVFSGGPTAGGRNFGVFDGSNSHRSAGITNLNWGVRSAIYSNIRLNSVNQNTNGTPNSSLRFNTVGLRPDQPTLNFHGYLGEVILYDEILPDSTLFMVENYLKTKYNPFPNLGNDSLVCNNIHKIGVRADNGYSQITWSTGQTNVDSIMVTSSGQYWVIVESFGLSLTDTINIGLTERPELNLLQDTVSCVNDGLFLTYDNLGPFEYTWSNGSMEDTLFNLSSGDYFLSQADSNSNCVIQTNTISVFVDSFSLNSTLGPDRIFCLGSELVLNTESTNNQPLNYNWSTGDVSDFVLLDFPIDTFIFLDVEDAFGCSFQDSIFATIQAVAAPNLDIIADTVCFGQPSSFNSIVSFNGTDAINSYLWSFPDLSSTNGSVATYTHNTQEVFQVNLTISTDSGCIASASQAVYLNNLPNSNFNDVIACAGNTVSITSSSTASFPAFITNEEWFLENNFIGDSTNISLTFDTEGQNNIKIITTTNQGCIDSIERPIEVFPALEPNFSVSNNCIGDSVVFTDETNSFSVVDWNWDFGPNANSNIQNPKIVFNLIGSLSVSLAVENAIGCRSTITKTININEQPTASFEYDKACLQDFALFNSTSVANNDSISTLNWKIGSDIYEGDSINHLFPELFGYLASLEIETQNGCKASATELVTVLENPIPNFTFSPNYGTAPIEVVFENLSEGINNYIWDFDDTSSLSNEENPSHLYTANGIYNASLTIINDDNCSGSVQKEVPIIPSDLDIELSDLEFDIRENNDGTFAVRPKMQISNVGTRLISNVDLVLNLDLENKFAIQWKDSLAINESVLYSFDSYYLVSNIAQSKYICVEAIHTNDNTEINFSNNKTCKLLDGLVQFSSAYPNPADAKVQLDIITENNGTGTVQIYSVNGKAMTREQNIELLSGYNNLVFDTETYQAGKYIILINYLEESYTKSFVIR